MNKPDALPDELDLILSDLNGIPRGKTIASKTLTDSEAPHLAEAIFFQTIMGGYSTALAKSGSIKRSPSLASKNSMPTMATF